MDYPSVCRSAHDFTGNCSVQARELVELAALVSAHAPVLVRGPDRIPSGSIEQYWVASRSRLDRWGHSLKRVGTHLRESDDNWHRSASPWIRGLLEEIVTGEVLTRVWAAVMQAYDGHRQVSAMEPVARSVLSTHLEARHRVLTLLVRSPDIDVELAVKLNRLRRRSEGWTDLLIGAMIDLDGAEHFAVNPDRAREFGEDLRYQQSQQGGRHVWPLMLASLKAGFGQTLGTLSPNADLNAKIGTSILACFPPGLFDSTGLVQSAWLLRVSSVTQDTQFLIDQLLAMEGQPNRGQSRGAPFLRISDRLRRFED
jgi:hypothetical protein